MKTAVNALLVIVGFISVFFVTVRFMGERAASHSASASPSDHDSDDIDIGVVHADAPRG